MKVSLMVADYASMSKDDKLNIMGIFTHIFVESVPATVPRLAVVIQIGLEFTERPVNRRLKIQLLDEDANVKIEYSADATFGKRVNGVMPSFRVIFEAFNLTFNNIGTYEFVVLLDDDIVDRSALFVVQK